VGKDDGRKEKSRLKKTSDIFLEYTDYASIQGLNYIFVENQTIFGRLFWSIVVFLMALLGSYWCVQSYLNWQNHPVLVTITTTAQPVTQVCTSLL